MSTLGAGGGRLRDVSNITRVISLGKFWYFGKLVAEERWSQAEVRLYIRKNRLPRGKKML